MAKVLKTFPFTTSDANKYPWNEWADGRIWSVTKDTDFDISAGNFRTSLYQKAKKLGMKVRVSMKDDTVVFQFFRE